MIIMRAHQDSAQAFIHIPPNLTPLCGINKNRIIISSLSIII